VFSPRDPGFDATRWDTRLVMGASDGGSGLRPQELLGRFLHHTEDNVFSGDEVSRPQVQMLSFGM
jgi:hypothetical protein